VKYWVLLVLNGLSGFGVGVILVIFRTYTLIDGHAPLPWMSWFYNAAQQLVGGLQIYSGIILIRSVLSIRRFFIERGAADFINSSMLLRHASCFIIYIVTTTSFFVAFGIYTFKPTTQIYEIAAAVGIFFQLGSCVSQILLCNIFWNLGKKIERGFNPNETREPSPSVLDVIV
jgi:hypothetical protein